MWKPNRIDPPVNTRPKSKGRLALDAVLFLAAAGVVAWAGLRDIFNGRLTVQRGPDVLLADQPGLFWSLLAVHIVIVLICLAVSALSARALLKSRP